MNLQMTIKQVPQVSHRSITTGYKRGLHTTLKLLSGIDLVIGLMKQSVGWGFGLRHHQGTHICCDALLNIMSRLVTSSNTTIVLAVKQTVMMYSLLLIQTECHDVYSSLLIQTECHHSFTHQVVRRNDTLRLKNKITSGIRFI